MKSLISILLITLLFAASASCAQAPAPQYPCEGNKQFDEFDCWVGEWDVRGGLTADGMLLVGTIHTVGNDTTQPFRGLWTALSDGRVRQFFEISADEGETWVAWFDGYYTRKAVDETAE